MSGDDAKHEQEANAPDATQDSLGIGTNGAEGDPKPPLFNQSTSADVTDDEADRLAAEADDWLANEEAKKNGPASEDETDTPLDDVDMRDVLRKALRPPQGAVAPELLEGVQKKLRARSRGKFYGDGWSTARSPRSTYLVTSVLMLVLIGFVFLILLPWGSGALP